MSTAQAIYGHGPTDRETAILDARDAGEAAASIAARLRLSERYVVDILERYNDGLRTEARFNRMVSEGSRRLAAAIAATGKVFA